MISELRTINPARACVPWWGKVPALAKVDTLAFQPGLNIIWAPNGAGKSTILRSIARMLHAEQGGQTTVTQESMGALFPLSERLFSKGIRAGYLEGVLPVHDGQAVIHVDPSHTVGMRLGGLDDDFFAEGLESLMSPHSSGEGTLAKMGTVFDVLTGARPWPKVDWRLRPELVNPDWKQRLAIVEETLRGTLPLGPPTILLDEPDKSLSIPFQRDLWRELPKATGQVQIIAATHSVFALDVPGAHYVDLVPGYRDACLKAMGSLCPKKSKGRRS